MSKILIFALLLFGAKGAIADPDWSEGAIIPNAGRPNPYELSEEEFQKARQAGRIHAQIYPVEITGSLPPYHSVKRLIENDNRGFFRRWISQIIRGVTRIKSFDDVEASLGLHPYPSAEDKGVYSVPIPEEWQGKKLDHRLGMGLIHRNGADGFTFSCAACHSSRLFGTTVLGMTNRFPRANEFFIQGKNGISAMPSAFFKASSKATSAEVRLYKETKRNIQFVGLKKPVVLGLDTSLSQVALSLNLRAPTPWAEKDERYLYNPTYDWLDDHPADSKPAVWWNVKYKNRWLSDGSVVSGNPIFTNILWNEIGRGVDLKVLAEWLRQNGEIIKEITTAVFSSEAPRFTDFFSADSFDIEAAQRGERIFENTCARCHGHYEKNWHQLGPEYPIEERLKTARVLYPQPTKVVDVGTDPHRRLGMRSLEKLNRLQISQENGIMIRAQEGYVPPPLVGIWARWPYFHNNSVPSLCAVLTPANERPKVYWARPADNKYEDFDANCNGYPAQLPEPLKKKIYRYETTRRGMSAAGHDEGIFLKNGRETLTSQDKKDLIRFLQTL